jgi:acyl-CoA reductase-like NAD-dependent aldehyde dehydrogenase
MSMAQWPLYVGNRPRVTETSFEVFDKYHGGLIGRVSAASPDIIYQAIGHAEAALSPMKSLPPYVRQEILTHCVRRFTERFDELADSLCGEAGKPIGDARGEVTRLIDTFRYAAEECVRLGGEVVEMQISARAAGRRGMTKRVPVGPCSFIAPFNFPLNLVAHKVAPAIAVGCPFVLKPASRTPLGALIIGEILAETDLPEGAFSILPSSRVGADLLTTDDRLKLLSFTGSPAVGWDLKARAGKKKVVLELGGNAAVVVDEDTEIEDCVRRVVIGAFYQSGQSCIGVQRILVHESIYGAFRDRLVDCARALRSGDPRDPEVFVGPMIDSAQADRVMDWIGEAIAAGGRLLCGGTREGNVVDATLLEEVPTGCAVVDEEVFGPVAVLRPFANFEEALQEVNRSRFGLQAGVFTRDLHKAMRAWDELEVGGVVIGDIPSWRVDHMPYGGVKDSGLGREGVRSAMEHMTEPRLLIIRDHK